MSNLQPPAVATWLLEHLQSSPDSDSLAGDLIEEYRHRRSRVWYWKQVLTAIFVSLSRELRSNPLLGLRALVIGWGVWYACMYLLNGGVAELLNPIGYRYPLAFGHVTPAVSVWWIIWLSERAGSGWIVARLHRKHATAMVMLFSVSVFLWKLQMVPWGYRVAILGIGDTRFRAELLAEMMSITLPSVCILLGGLWACRGEKAASAKGAPALI